MTKVIKRGIYYEKNIFGYLSLLVISMILLGCGPEKVEVVDEIDELDDRIFALEQTVKNLQE